MDYALTKHRADETGQYGAGWYLAELLLFPILTLLTGGLFFLMCLFSNLQSRGLEETAWPWERRNHAGYVLYHTTLKGKVELVVETLAAKFRKAFSRG